MPIAQIPVQYLSLLILIASVIQIILMVMNLIVTVSRGKERKK